MKEVPGLSGRRSLYKTVKVKSKGCLNSIFNQGCCYLANILNTISAEIIIGTYLLTYSYSLIFVAFQFF